MNEDVRISRRDAAVLNRRALRLMWKTNPAVFVSTGLASAVKALTPYVAIYFSARLIGELAGRRSVPVLTHLVLILLLATALLSLLGAALTRWKNAVREAGDFRGAENFRRQNSLHGFLRGGHTPYSGSPLPDPSERKLGGARTSHDSRAV
jgi:ABC-type multidrug transport system fused ATPase/permease subunit